MVNKIGSEIESWDAGHAIATLSKKYASIFMATGGKLNYDISGPKSSHLLKRMFVDALAGWNYCSN